MRLSAPSSSRIDGRHAAGEEVDHLPRHLDARERLELGYDDVEPQLDNRPR